MKNILKRIARVFGYRTFLITAIFFKYNFRLSRLRVSKPSNSGRHYAIANELNELGACKLCLDDFGLTGSDLHEFVTDVSKLLDYGQKNEVLKACDIMNKPFVNKLLNSQFFRDLINSYFVYSFKVRDCAVWRNIPDGGGWSYKGWHFDRNHLRALHFDINLLDITKSNGPVEVLSPKASRRLFKTAWGGEFFSDYMEDSKAFQLEDVCDGSGPAGTVTIYDAMRSVHRGGHCLQGQRLVLHLVLNENVFWRQENYPVNISIS